MILGKVYIIVNRIIIWVGVGVPYPVYYLLVIFLVGSGVWVHINRIPFVIV